MGSIDGLNQERQAEGTGAEFLQPSAFPSSLQFTNYAIEAEK